MKRAGYIVAGAIALIVVVVLVMFAIYGERLPYMATQICGRITHNYTWCASVIPLPDLG